MAGYLFQPERALFWLAKSRSGAKVGIETEDDIVLQAKYSDEFSIREQDKHSISSNIPFGDHSKDLWNTLYIWLNAIFTNEVDPLKTKFYLVTNKKVEDGIAKSLSSAKHSVEIAECIELIRKENVTVPKGISEYASKVCQFSDTTLALLIENIELSDASSDSLDILEIKSLLHIPDDMPFDEIYNSLLGWVHYCAISLWRINQPAWLTRDSFDVYYQKLVSRYKIKSFMETAKSLLPISESERAAQYNKTFVRQLYLLALEKEDDLLIDCIDDFLRCISERTKLSVKGNITKEEIALFDQNLVDRWKLIFAEFNREYKRKAPKSEDIHILGEDIGLKILLQTLNHREPLAGQQTEQYYLTSGSYHRLSNKLHLGWHPEYKVIMNQLK
jgi:hypothetical protein